MTYQFDQPDAEAVAEVLTVAAGTASDLQEVWQHLWLDSRFQSLDETLRAEIDFLFTNELQEDFASSGEVTLTQSEYRVTATRPLAQTPPAAWTLWTALLESVPSPMIASLINDSILTSGHNRTPAQADQTVQAYLGAAQRAETSDLWRSLALARANSIARSRKMTVESTVRQRMLTRLAQLEDSPGNAHASMTLISALSVPPRSGEAIIEARDYLHELACNIGESAPEFADEVARILVDLAQTPADLESAKRWHVEHKLNLAKADTHNMRRILIATEAVDLAERYGLTDLRDAATVFIQSTPQTEDDWETFDTSIPISKNHFRLALRKYRWVRSWQTAILAFLAAPAPTGSHTKNVAESKNGSAGSIRRLFKSVSFGPHGLPVKKDVDFEERELQNLESMALGTNSIVLALELEHIWARFPPPSADTVTTWLTKTFTLDPSVARHFSEALFLHFEGRFSESSRVSIPLIERAARSLLLLLDEPMYRSERGNSPGKFPAMDFYIEALARHNLDEDWVRALRATLLSDGSNLRNLAAHGYLFDFSESQSALLLRLAGLFCAMPLPRDDRSVLSPTEEPRRRLRRRLGWVWS